MAAGEVESVDLLLLVGGEIGRILQPDVAAAGEFGMVLTFLTADFVHGVVDEFDDVELVKGDGGVGQLGGNAFDEGGRHVGADLGNGFGIASMELKILGKSGDRSGIVARSDE